MQRLICIVLIVLFSHQSLAETTPSQNTQYQKVTAQLFQHKAASYKATLIPTEIRLQHEMINYAPSLNNPDNKETLGFSSLIYDIYYSHGFGLITGIYGATTGRRGGLIALGIGLSHHYSFNDWLGYRSSFVVGGGGGDGALETVKSGLMLRADASLRFETDVANLGLGYSYVSFPTGTLKGQQPFVELSFPTNISDIEKTVVDSGKIKNQRDGLVEKKYLEIAPLIKNYFVSGKNYNNGNPMRSDVQLVGFGLNAPIINNNWFYHLDLYGAYRGNVAGYMSVVTGIGYKIPLNRKFSLLPMGLIGFAGGGGVDTEGGFIIEPKLGLNFNFNKYYSLYAAASYWISQSGSFDVPTIELGLNKRFYFYRSDKTISKRYNYYVSEKEGSLRNIRVRVGHQVYDTRNETRKGSKISLPSFTHLLGMNFDYFINDWLFANGGTFWAYGGESGSYASGLLGIGTHFPFGILFIDPLFQIGAGAGGLINSGQALMFKGSLLGGVNLSKNYSLYTSVSRIVFPKGTQLNTAEIGVGVNGGILE